jgi:hypothetical protein
MNWWQRSRVAFSVRACRLAADCLFAQGSGFTAAQAEYLTWAERSAHFAERESIELCYADLASGWAGRVRKKAPESRVWRAETGTSFVAQMCDERLVGLRPVVAGGSSSLGKPRSSISWDAPA